jgi:hypothetical protein
MFNLFKPWFCTHNFVVISKEVFYRHQFKWNEVTKQWELDQQINDGTWEVHKCSECDKIEIVTYHE